MSLIEFLSQVKEANPTLAAARARAQALKHRIAPLSTLDDPFIAAGLDNIPFNGGGEGSIRYQLSQTLPFPGKLGAKGDSTLRRSEALAAESETMDRSLKVLATQAYYRTFFNLKAYLLNEQSLKYISDTIDSTKARYQTGGEGSHHEWLLAKIELGVLEAEKLRLGREQKTLYAFLNELRNQPANTPIVLGDVLFDSERTIESDPQKLLEDQPELLSAQKISESAQADERAARLSYFPDFVIQGMAMQPRSTDMGEHSTWGVMVGISLPLYSWRKQSEQVRSSKLEREAAEAEKKNLENRLRTEIIDAKEQLHTSRDIVDLYQKNVIPNSELAENNARNGYAARTLPLTQLIDILKVRRIQQLELIAAKIDVELAKMRLENLLSSPPFLKFAPSKPTVFGGASMSGNMNAGTSGTVNMGSGMSGPTRREQKAPEQGSGTSGMGNMK